MPPPAVRPAGRFHPRCRAQHGGDFLDKAHTRPPELLCHPEDERPGECAYNAHNARNGRRTAAGRGDRALQGAGGNYKYKVISRSNKNFQSPSGPERAAETEAVDAESDRDICTGAGWQSVFEKCPVPLINISTGETTERLPPFHKSRDLPDNHKDNILCFDDDVFGDAESGVRGRFRFTITPTPTIRYVHDCPVGAPSADYKICQCPNTQRLHAERAKSAM